MKVTQKPSINLESKPRITVELSPVHEAFLRFCFGTPEKEKHIILTRRHDIGKLIFGHIMSGDFQSPRPLMIHPVTFILPMPNFNHGYWLRYRHVYMPQWSVEKITDAIDYEFRAWVKDRFRIGYELEGMEQRVIVNAILRGLRMRNNQINFDTIKKIDYRSRRKKEEIQFKRLLTIEKSEC